MLRKFMRQSGKILIIGIIMFFSTLCVYSALSGKIDYQIPVDYSKLSESELAEKADFYYDKALKSSGRVNDDMTSALNLYTMLKHKAPNNIVYPLRLGKLYDTIGKDRYAKGNYYHAMGVNPSAPAPYYYLGDYFYNRSQYRKALKMYKRAYDAGYSENEQMLTKMNAIKKKLGMAEKSDK